MRHRILIVALIAILAVAAVVGSAGVTAQEPDQQNAAAAVGTAFTYQGRLTDDQGNPLTGQYDFEFRLYDGSGSGAGQVGSTIPVNGKQVDDGRFTVELDFGTNAFAGDARWLEISVRESGSGGGFTQLLPRQELTPAPYALHAGEVPWSGISGVPGDLADGDDDTTYSAGAGLSLSETTFSVDFAGNGSATTAAHSDHNHDSDYASTGHDHLGQTWAGNDNPLLLSGAFDAANNTPAPLMIENLVDSGVFISSTGSTAVAVASAGRNGVGVGQATEDGLSVISAGEHGVYVSSAGSDGVHVGQAGSNGVEVTGAEHDGLYIGHAGSNGVDVDSADGIGMHVRSAGFDGVNVGSAGSDGVQVSSAGRFGVRVVTASTGIYVDSAASDGVRVSSADGTGVDVGSTGGTAFEVHSAGINGMSVLSTDRHGIYVTGADADNNGSGVAGYFNGDVTVTGNLNKGSSNFRIDHPQDPENMYLVHSVVESPEMMNVYNGNVTTDDEGYATVTLPDYFEALNTDYRYQLTVIGTFAQAIVAEEIEGNQFVIRTDEPNVKVSWQVTGVRDDPYAQANPIEVEEEKPADEQGLYLHPEAYDQPASKGIGYAGEGESQ